MPLPRRRAARPRLLAVLTCAVVLAGCTGDTEPDRSAPPSGGPTDAQLDLASLPVPRTDFCRTVPDDAVRGALAGAVATTSHYGIGDEVEVSPGLTDVVHEYGCVFEGQDGTVARAWVFARSVGRDEARALVRRTRGEDCATPDSIDFGTPSTATVCSLVTDSEEALRVRLEGLFTDSWVGCEIVEPGADRSKSLLRRTEQWCTEVVSAAGAR
jgi:hypothetical protein